MPDPGEHRVVEGQRLRKDVPAQDHREGRVQCAQAGDGGRRKQLSHSAWGDLKIKTPVQRPALDNLVEIFLWRLRMGFLKQHGLAQFIKQFAAPAKTAISGIVRNHGAAAAAGHQGDEHASHIVRDNGVQKLIPTQRRSLTFKELADMLLLPQPIPPRTAPHDRLHDCIFLRLVKQLRCVHRGCPMHLSTLAFAFPATDP